MWQATYPVVELDGFDDPLVGIQQRPNVFFVSDELDIFNDGSSRDLGFVKIVLYLGALRNVLDLSIDKLYKTV